MADNDSNLTPLPPPPPGLRQTALRSVANRGPLVAYLLIVIAVLVAVNVLASRHDKSWDLTKSHQYSLSSESVTILHNLKQPLHLLYFGKTTDFGSAKDLLGRYARESNKVDVQYIDPDRHPDQAKQYGIQTYGTIVVLSGDHKETVANLAEQDLTNAIVRTLKGARKVIYFTAGEGENDPDDTGRGGYSTLKTALETENFTVQKLVLAQSPAVPADCAVLIIAGPSHPLVAPEMQAISHYVDGGGRLLVMVGVSTAGPLVDYLENPLDVNLPPGVVVDTSGIGQLFGASELMPIAAQYDPHPITAQMNGTATLFPFARVVEPGSVPGTKAVVSPLVETTPKSQVAQLTGDHVNLSPNDRKGPLTLGVAGTMPATVAAGPQTGDSAETRYVVYGSPDFVSNSIIGFNGNRDLFLNSMNWLSTQENFITIRPQTPTNAPVNLTAAQMRWVFFIFLVGLPLAIVIIGIGVWWRRRAL